MISLQGHNFHVTGEPRGVVTVAWDVPQRSVNVLNQAVFAELQTLLAELESDPTLRLVLFTSGKDSAFLAGADLREIEAIRGGQAAARFSALGQEVFRRVQRLAVPTVAAIAGSCLGGGLEFALACRYRLARDDGRMRLGFPEVGLGLSPAWGGTQRLPQLVGLAAALPMLLEGRTLLARPAAAVGLVNGTWTPGAWAGGVRRFVADRLAGRSFHRRQRGLPVRLFDQTRHGRRLLLERARRQVLLRCGPNSAAAAILAAVHQGVLRGPEAGLAREARSPGGTPLHPALPQPASAVSPTPPS